MCVPNYGRVRRINAQHLLGTIIIARIDRDDPRSLLRPQISMREYNKKDVILKPGRERRR
jgi:hypothetical protein